MIRIQECQNGYQLTRKTVAGDTVKAMAFFWPKHDGWFSRRASERHHGEWTWTSRHDTLAEAMKRAMRLVNEQTEAEREALHVSERSKVPFKARQAWDRLRFWQMRVAVEQNRNVINDDMLRLSEQELNRAREEYEQRLGETEGKAA